MRNLFWFLFFISTITLGQSQSVDGAFKTLTATGTGTYTITEALPAAYSSKERFNIRFTSAPVTPSSATLNRSGLGAKALKRNDGTVLRSGDITAGNAYLISYNGTYYQCETCGTSVITGDLSTSTTGISFTGATGAVVGSGTTINIQNSTNGQPGLLTAADHTSFNAKVDRAGDTMSGALAMGSNKITGLAAGTNSSDAVRFDQIQQTGWTNLTLINSWSNLSTPGLSYRIVNDMVQLRGTIETGSNVKFVGATPALISSSNIAIALLCADEDGGSAEVVYINTDGSIELSIAADLSHTYCLDGISYSK